MKKFALTLALVLTLGAKAMAHGCWCFWPGFGIGVGLGGLCGVSLGVGVGCGWSCGACCPVYGYAYSQPSYGYSQPAYAPPAYGYAADYADPPAAAPSPSYIWVPSTPGAGHWVPDPAPYSYTPAPASRLRQVVTMSRSPEGIPVYNISYSR